MAAKEEAELNIEFVAAEEEETTGRSLLASPRSAAVIPATAPEPPTETAYPLPATADTE
ncbi:hypothetical protein GGI11_005016 [Coemansia sp. RSA 2049]|nr:hypothetical protein GGI11_005016 [Coemansia sp. RSA 2049]